jgi:hypothetical protein
MEIDHSKLPRRITPQYIALLILCAVVVAVLFVVFSLLDRSAWSAQVGLELTYVTLAVSTVALITLCIFPIRSRIDPTGLIYGFVDDRTPAKRRLALRNLALMYSVLAALLAYVTSLFVPECALDKACIDFSEPSIFLLVSKALLPLMLIVVFGKMAGNGIAFAIAWMRG